MSEKDKIYDKLSRVLTEYENGILDAQDLYTMLCQIQANWETVITAIE